jgi:hypothetical protein
MNLAAVGCDEREHAALLGKLRCVFAVQSLW